VSEAFLWGFLAGSSLVIGGLLALTGRVGNRLLGLIMAFGAGVLISAVSFELVQEAFETAGFSGSVAVGLFAGAVVFFVGDAAIDRFGGRERKRIGARGDHASDTAYALVLGIVLDGIPESMVIGLGLVEGGAVSAAVIVAVFLSNLPEAIAATSGLLAAGWQRGRVLGLWLVMALVTALASLAGYAWFDGASDETVAFMLAFAGGAVLTMLADTMMPEAFEHGGKLVGLATTLGFAVAFAITALE
jgi:zinc transporter, ZIP family